MKLTKDELEKLKLFDNLTMNKVEGVLGRKITNDEFINIESMVNNASTFSNVTM